MTRYQRGNLNGTWIVVRMAKTGKQLKRHFAFSTSANGAHDSLYAMIVVSWRSDPFSGPRVSQTFFTWIARLLPSLSIKFASYDLQWYSISASLFRSFKYYYFIWISFEHKLWSLRGNNIWSLVWSSIIGKYLMLVFQIISNFNLVLDV